MSMNRAELVEQNNALRGMIEQLRDMINALPESARPQYFKMLDHCEEMELELEMDMMSV